MSSSLFEAIAQSRREKAAPRATGLTLEEKADIKKVFNLFDADGSGSIDGMELRTVLTVMGFQHTREEVKAMIATVDVDGGGTIDFSEFLLLLSNATSKADAKSEATKTFGLFTGSPNEKKITVQHLRRVAEEAGQHLTDAELQAMIDVADSDDSGDVDLHEFLHMLQRTGNL